ncbi:MAG: O-antigen ligase family protein [Patescibacteria group bacterium]
MNYLIYLNVLLIPSYIFRFELCGIPTNVFEIAVAITFIAFLAVQIAKKKKIKINNVDWAIIFFLFFAFLAILISPDKRAALGIFKSWFIAPSLLYFITKETIAKKDAYKLAIPVFISLMLVTAWAILQKLGIISTLFYQVNDLTFNQYLHGNVRLFGPFGSPNYLAMFIVPSFFLSLALFSKIKNVALKILFLLLEVAPLVVLYYTKSRGGVLALGFGMVIYVLVYSLHKFNIYKSLNLRAIITSIMAVLTFLVYAFGFYSPNDHARREIYRYAWQMIKSHPVTGIGLDNFQGEILKLSAGNISFQQNILSYALHPHNLFLAMWLYVGLGGLIAFLILILQFFGRAFHSLHDKMAIFPIAAMTAMLAHGLVDTTFFKNDLSALFFITLAFVIIINQNAEKNPR